MNRVIDLPVVFTNDGMQLVGMVHRPEGEPHPPAVVFFHGCTTTRNEAHGLFVKVGRALARRGILAFRFDFRYNGESEGDFRDLTLSAEVSDGIRAVETVVRDHGADPSRIGLVGMSMGGAIGAIVAGRLRDRISACALLNPVSRPVDDLLALAARHSLDTATFPIAFKTFLFGERFVRELDSIRPLEEIGRATCPFLLVNGTGDATVDPARSREYLDAIHTSGGLAELCELPGADHLFSSIHWEHQINTRLDSWFAARFGLDGTPR